MNTWIDQTGTVRPGEELDAARLEVYLRAQLDQPGAELKIEQFPGGFSNLTYLLRLGDRDYVLRRPPHGSKVKSAHDMGREYRVLSRLAPVFDKAPRPVLFCDDSAVIGAEFYLMERIRGVIIRRDPPPGLVIDETTSARLCEALIDALAALHGIDYAAAGLGDMGRPEGYVERQITGWTGRYQAAQTDALPAMEEVGAWLAAHMPADSAAALIHNDFKFDNVILDPADITRIIGILDWEMSTIGDPLMDLGTSLSYWVERDDPPALQEIRFVPTTLPGMMTRAELALRYADKSGRDVAHILFYYVYGLFKIAVVAQQIYYRFVQGLTRDERFAGMIHGVRAMSAQARAALDRGKI
jgi:aminoglycoside phosphotransferase (APT) family kinase protein